MIEIKNINKHYTLGNEQFHVLKNISLNIKEADYISIIGPSGSGKSTLVKILGLLDRDYDGEYIFDNENVDQFYDNKLSEIRNKKIGFIFQNFNLIKRLTVKENIQMPMLYSGYKENEAKDIIRKLLKEVKLEEKIDRYPSELSGGQQQRIAIARALINEPKIIIADEPTGALDSNTTKEILSIFRALNEKGVTIIIITHDINVAKQADRIVKIFDGKLVEEKV